MAAVKATVRIRPFSPLELEARAKRVVAVCGAEGRKVAIVNPSVQFAVDADHIGQAVTAQASFSKDIAAGT